MNENEGVKTMWEREKETTKATEYSHFQKELRAVFSRAKEGSIDMSSLCLLCFKYDLYYHEYPEHSYEGLSLCEFFLGLCDGDCGMVLGHVWEDELEDHWKKEQDKAVEEE